MPKRIIALGHLFLLILIFCLAASAQTASAQTAAEKGEKKKKNKNDPETHLAKAQTLYEKGKYEKALQSFQLAKSLSPKKCLDCDLGLFRAAVGRGRWRDIAPASGAVLDAIRGSSEHDALVREIEDLYRQALASTQGSDSDVLWGLIDVLAHRGQSGEIVRVASQYLDTRDKKSLICAADYRVSLAQRVALPVAQEINDQLRGLNWDGPFLLSEQFRRPKLRNKSFQPGKGARMSGVLDRIGALDQVRVVRPPPGKVTVEVRDKMRRALFNPATYKGRRTAVCYPFSVTLPGQIALAQKAGSGGPSLYELIAGFDSLEAIVDLIGKAGANIALPQRAAICGARDWHDEINQRLAALDWPGPFFDTEAVQDPVAHEDNAVAKYSEAAREANVEGEVVIAAVISDTGKVVHYEVLEPLPSGLSGQAVNVVRTWKYQPAEMGGNAINVCRKITVEFKLTSENQQNQP